MPKLEVKLSGGLGNQIFQLYAGMKIAQLQQSKIRLNLTDVARSHSKQTIQSFQVNASFKTHRFWRWIRSHLHYVSKVDDWVLSRKKHHLIDIDYLENTNFSVLRNTHSISGYFQDFRYMEDFRHTPPRLRNPSDVYLSMEESLKGVNFAAVHIRRGDFLGQSNSHGCLSPKWYIREVELLWKRDSRIDRILVFSDDIEWVRENIQKSTALANIKFDFEPASLIDPAESWSIMRQASHIICANSTFSLTAAYFSNADVVVPWPLTKNSNFKDISKSLPKEWILSPTIWE